MEDEEQMKVSRDEYCATCKYRGEMGVCIRGVVIHAQAPGCGGLFHCRHYALKRFVRVGDIVRTKKGKGIGIVTKVSCRTLTQDYEAAIDFYDLTPDKENGKSAWWSAKEIDILEVPVQSFESHYILNGLAGGQPDYPLPKEKEFKEQEVISTPEEKATWQKERDKNTLEMAYKYVKKHNEEKQ